MLIAKCNLKEIAVKKGFNKTLLWRSLVFLKHYFIKASNLIVGLEVWCWNVLILRKILKTNIDLDNIESNIPLSMVSDDDLKEEYDNLYEDLSRWESEYSAAFVYNSFKSYFKDNEIRHILDVGCGTGFLLNYLSGKLSCANLVGIDLSERVIDFAKNRYKHIKFLLTSLQDIWIKDKFDLILMVGTLEHFKNPVEVLNKISDILSFQGRVFIETPHNLIYSKNKREGFRRLDCGSRQWEWHLMRNSWEHLIKASKLKIIKSISGPRPEMEFCWILERRD